MDNEKEIVRLMKLLLATDAKTDGAIEGERTYSKLNVEEHASYRALAIAVLRQYQRKPKEQRKRVVSVTKAFKTLVAGGNVWCDGVFCTFSTRNRTHIFEFTDTMVWEIEG